MKLEGCLGDNGLDCRLHNPAARQFHQHVVTDFVFGNGGGILPRNDERMLRD
jgi:hypothetical protein